MSPSEGGSVVKVNGIQLAYQVFGGMTRHRLAILPGLTHYDIYSSPALSRAVIPFLDGA